MNGNTNQLKGIGTVQVVGTINLEVSLHPRVKARQLFQVVDQLDIILIRRKFLMKFGSLGINWKEMAVDIAGNKIP